MFSVRSLGTGLLLAALSTTMSAQTTLPALKAAFANRTLVGGGAPAYVNLRSHFMISNVTGSLVQFDTTKGKFNAELFSADTPKTVTNFLNYTAKGAYTNGILHRSVPNFVVQGGGFTLVGSTITPVTTDPAVENEPKFSNTRGTLAMAKTDAGPSTATSQWFVNLNNNAAVLDAQNGGFTVFGRVLGTGMTVVDALAAVPTYNATAQLGASFGELPLLANELTTTNLLMVNIAVIPMLPELAHTKSALSFTATSSNTGVATVELIASTLTVKPVAAGTATITVRAQDTNGNATESSFTATVAAAPAITTSPQSQAVAASGNATLSVAATAGAALQWQRNGGNLSGIDSATVNVTNMQTGLVGLYTVVATSGSATAVSNPAILGITTSTKVVGQAQEVGTNILHPNGKRFDQVLLEGTAAAIKADYSPDPALTRITRMSFIDLDDDIVQVELAGPGTLSILLDESTGPAAPTKYNQPSVSYMKGHASIVITGATEQTNVSVFTVGRATANDPTGGFRILEPISATNNPANNGSSLFQGHSATVYDGIADLARISIISTNGKFGGIRAANASFYDVKGHTGIYAPGVTFQGPVYVADINAYAAAVPVLVLGGAVSNTWITGGDLYQDNGVPVTISGVTQLHFKPGSDSHGRELTAAKNQGILLQDGVNVTSQVVVNP